MGVVTGGGYKAGLGGRRSHLSRAMARRAHTAHSEHRDKVIKLQTEVHNHGEGPS